MFKNLKNKLLLVILLIILASIFWSYKNNSSHMNIGSILNKNRLITPDQNIRNSASKAQLSDQQTLKKESLPNPSGCDNLKDEIENEKHVLNNKSFNQRFENLHFKKDGEIYRTREFLDNDSEGDFKVYLVYNEDLEENTTIMEQSKRKPGKLFLEFKKFIKLNPESILFQERGYESLTDDQYIIYQDGKISGFQGKFQNSPIECHFFE